MSQPLSFEFMIDEAEQVRVATLVSRRGRGSRVWRRVRVAVLALPFILALVFRWPLSVVEPYLGVLALVGVLTLLMPSIQRWQAGRLFRESPALRGPLTYELKMGGFALRTPLTSAEVSWEAIREAIETPDMFVMLLTQRFAYYIPKRVVGSRAAELRAFLVAQLGDRASSLRSSPGSAVA